MGPENAQRMLGPEGWIPNAEEALEVGIVQEVVPHDQVLKKNFFSSLIQIYHFYVSKINNYLYIFSAYGPCSS